MLLFIPNNRKTGLSKKIFSIEFIIPSFWHLQILNHDKELITFVQKAMGYCLCSDVSEQIMFILWGAGANGKTTFLNVISDLLGDYAMATQTETFVKKQGETLGNDIARLRGSRMVTTTELEQGKHFSESLIKQVTGNDTMTARFLYGEYFTFIPTFKIFMATNHKPVIKGNDYGIWRRIRLIPFTVTIPPELMDRELTEKLKAENSGILNWLLEGFRLWQKEGLASPETVKKATQEYQEDMDTVGSFIKECCQIDASGVLRISNKELYEAYQHWADTHGEKQYSQKFIALRLQEKGFKKMVGNSERFWLGLGLKGAIE